MISVRLILVALFACSAAAFTMLPSSSNNARSATAASTTQVNGVFDKIGEMFTELDNFMDDATARRLGAGANFYGKRKSSFYGKEDKGRKRDPGMPDPTEDFQGPASGGLYKWIQNDEGRMVPVTRRRNTPLERNPSFWDRVYDQKSAKEEKSN